MVYCTGRKCTAVDGFGHSLECIEDHDKAVHAGAGNRNPECRYRGYKGEPLQKGCTEDQRAAWVEGDNARLR